MTSPSIGKNTSIVVEPCCIWKCVPNTIFLWYQYSRVFWVPFVTKCEFSVRITKIASVISVSFTHNLSIIYKIKPQNSLNCGYTNMCGVHANFVHCESSKPSEILALYEKNLEEWIDPSNFCFIHMPGLEVHVK